jgi:trehalose 6-phosphate synthase
MNRLVIVSNRVPVPSAGMQAGGLAVALGDLMDKRGGMWFGWSGQIANGPSGAVRVQQEGGVDYATVDLTQDEHDRYYGNFSNGVLWPLLHTMPDLIQYDRHDARVYREVNERMAALLQPLLRPYDIIWVHDYHLLSLPAALRACGVRNPIGFFLHIPFAAPDLMTTAPEMAGLVRGVLSADLIGFQTENDLLNFATTAEILTGAARTPGNTLLVGGRRVRLGVFPVEIEAHGFAKMAGEMEHTPVVERLRRTLTQQRLILGVERLDPSKGLLQRVAGLRRLLEKRENWRRRVTLLQIAALSRTDVSCYRALRTALDRAAGSLNADLGEADWMPLRLLSRGIDRATVAGYMRLAGVALVTPVRDGMNLVAKEYVAAQNPENPGVLVLSQFAGAAQQLDAAVLVNPHDPDALADALDTALTMRLAERQARWQAMWSAIQGRSPLAWGRTFLAALLRANINAPQPGSARRSGFEPVPAGYSGVERLFPEHRPLVEHLAGERDPRQTDGHKVGRLAMN